MQDARKIGQEIQRQNKRDDLPAPQSRRQMHHETQPSHKGNRQLFRRTVFNGPVAVSKARLLDTHAPSVHEIQEQEPPPQLQTARPVVQGNTRSDSYGGHLAMQGACENTERPLDITGALSKRLERQHNSVRQSSPRGRPCGNPAPW